MPDRVAIIEISSKILLDFLDFKGGEICDIRMPLHTWKANFVEIVVSHPDLPPIKPGEALCTVIPLYQQTDDGKHIVVSRIKPEKGGKP